MNVREEDRQKNNCSSRGLGLAAVAVGVGVGVGAALYYLFSKSPENSEGSSFSERPHTFDDSFYEDESNSYTTISEHTSTDTSILVSEESFEAISDESNSIWSIHSTQSSSDHEDSIESGQPSQSSAEDVDSVETGHLNSDVTTDSYDENLFDFDSRVSDEEVETEYMTMNFNTGDVRVSDLDWEITDSTFDMFDRIGTPPLVSIIRQLRSLVNSSLQCNKRTAEEERMILLREKAFRERTWSLEECSICFDVILKDHKVTTLPCTHHFHAECIGPWLQQQQTCPNCRKAAE